MSITATGTTSLVAFTLPGTPRSARAARNYVKTALGNHDLSYLAEDVEAVTSELVANAVRHAQPETVDVDLLLLKDDAGSLVVLVFDLCARPPIRRDPTRDAEQGRGLVMVEALATRWGWIPQNPGKAVFALFTLEG
jgi:anti-sigma regulatory factor (Ser/Thr protein kinase)